MKNITELIDKLTELRTTHGELPIVHNDIQLTVTGISYKYLIIASNYLTYKPKTESNEGQDSKV